LITTIALLALVDTSVAIAQTAGSRNPAAPPSTNSNQQLLPEAPVGHRQPRADQVPSEKNLMDPNDPVNQENAALDRMIKGICRGCQSADPHLGQAVEPLDQQLHGGIDEVARQVSRLCDEASDLRTANDQYYLRRGTVGITDPKSAKYSREPRPHFLLV
jgi:hypothetical protein